MSDLRGLELAITIALTIWSIGNWWFSARKTGMSLAVYVITILMPMGLFIGMMELIRRTSS